MTEEISIRELKEMSDTSNTPFAMAILDDKCEIAMYGSYHEDFARHFSHIPLYTKPQLKPLSDEEIYELWCEADNTELLPEMRLKDGSINYIITTFTKLIEETHGIK